MPTARRQRTLMASPTPRLVAWYDAGTLALSDTNAVAAWEDTTRLSTGVAQGTGANQPIYKHNGTDDINGLPVVEFDGTDDKLSSAVLPPLGGSHTVFVVARSDTAAASGTFYGFGGSPARDLSFGLTGASPGLIVYDTSSAIINDAGSNYVPSTPYLATLVKDRTTVRVYVNGVLKKTVVTGRARINLAGTFYIGAQNASLPYKKHIVEIKMYAGAMSDAQRQAEEARLNAKYALF